ncbi:DUF6056 family protein [Photorhabdus laumondii]|uniref:DUF6056 family protein n=1 Tax=Photorhabdus laumondii TaxID=2218628 RepID=UPI0025B20D36|nr:DUF6056 family protein [Photorhabdus laumondii]
MSSYSKKIYSLILTLSFLLVSYISYMTPMQSDDYSYLLKGLDLQTHINHYLYWSGRFISDYISSFILVLTNNFSKSIIISLSLVSMTLIISFIPSILYKRKNSTYCFVFIFSLYWIANPTLGQTVFWVVGAANYLVTNLFICIYLILLALYISGSKKPYLPLLIFSIPAGLSNENTSIIVVCISFVSSCYHFIRKNDFRLFASTVLVIVGAGLLILSPGNFARASNQAFDWWTQMTLFGKIEYFVKYSLPISLKRIYALIATSIILLFIANKIEKNKEIIIISLLSLLAGFASIFSMIFAPTFPARALSGPCLFMIISCSFSFNAIINSNSKVSIRIINIIIFTYLLLFFISYTLMAYSYNRLSIQEYIRKQSIISNIDTGELNFSIPNFYWPKSFKSGDSVDKFSPESALGKLYNVDSIDAYEPYFDYSILLDSKEIHTDTQITNTLTINGVYIGKNGLFSGSSIALSLHNTSLSTINLDISIVDTNGIIHSIKGNDNNTYFIRKILNKYVIGFTVNIDRKNIKEIIINNKKVNIR